MGACQTPTVRVPHPGRGAAGSAGWAISPGVRRCTRRPATRQQRSTSDVARTPPRDGSRAWVRGPRQTRACIVPRPYSGTGVVDGLMGIFAGNGGIWRHAMRIGRGRHPRRRDPRRRFRNRLLVGMVGVALLPLVAFAVLAVFELDTVAKSTANATEIFDPPAPAGYRRLRRSTAAPPSLDRSHERRSTATCRRGSPARSPRHSTVTQPANDIPATGPGTYSPPPPACRTGPEVRRREPPHRQVVQAATSLSLRATIRDQRRVVTSDLENDRRDPPCAPAIQRSRANLVANPARFAANPAAYDPVVRANVLAGSEGGVPDRQCSQRHGSSRAPGRATDRSGRIRTR